MPRHHIDWSALRVTQNFHGRVVETQDRWFIQVTGTLSTEIVEANLSRFFAGRVVGGSRWWGRWWGGRWPWWWNIWICIYIYIWCTTWCVSTHLKNMLVKLDHLPNRRPYDQGLWKPVWFPLIRPATKNPYFWRGYPRGVGWPAIIFGGKTSFGDGIVIERSWNPKQPFINGCFNWMIPDLHIRKWLFHQTSIYKCLFGVPGFYMNITFTVVGAFLRVSHQTNDNFDMNFCFFFLRTRTKGPRRVRGMRASIFNRRYLFKWLFFHCQVSLRGSKCVLPFLDDGKLLYLYL